jgi:hypothetical protein
VTIRNLTIDGLATGGVTSLSGILFLVGSELTVQNVAIYGFGGPSGTHAGIEFDATNGRLAVLDSQILYSTGDGILIKGSGGVTAALTHVSSIMNGGAGLRLDTTNASTPSFATARDSTFSQNTFGILVASTPGAPLATAILDHDMATGNSVAGLDSNGAASLIRVGNSTITANANGFAAPNGGLLQSYVTNELVSNTNDGFATSTISMK